VADTLAAQPATARERPTCFGVYHAVERIAAGGMGEVFRAEDMRDRSSVAIKTVVSSRNADAAALRREIVTLSRLDHPGIVRLRGYGVQSGGPWLALELLEGGTLVTRMSSYWPARTTDGERAPSDERPTAPVRRRRGGRSWIRSTAPYAVAGGGHLGAVLSIARQLCLALDHVHSRGLVHRDVKPANVIVDGDGRATLIDFGLACSPSDASAGELCVGTMEYAAPEQIYGGRVDHRADIYSLGCLLYELITGQIPFSGDSSGEIAERQMKHQAIPPSHLVADVPSALEDLIMSMLAKAPAQRPGSAAEIALHLARIQRRHPDAGASLDAAPLALAAG